MGAIRQLTGSDAAKQAKRAQASADTLAQKQLEQSQQWYDDQRGLALEERDYQRGITDENRQTAMSDYLRRLGIVDELAANADFSPDFYDQQIGSATADVRSSLDKSRSTALRQMEASGVDPSSGAYGAMSDRFALTGAALEANAANTTRMGLATEERSRQDAARTAGLSVTPQIISAATGNPTVGLTDPTIAALGAAAGDKSAQAAGWSANSASSRAGLMQAIGTVAGAAIRRPAGAEATVPTPKTTWT